jgi:hypothetical protein
MSETETVERRIPHITVTERKTEALMRRLENPADDSYNTPVVRLRDDPTGERWQLRWFNTAISGRLYVMRNKGYEAVMRAEVANLDELTELAEAADGIVRRGEKGQEVLGKIPKADYQFIKRREVELRERRSQSTRSLRAQAAEAAAAKFGAEAGDFIEGKPIGGGLIKSVGDIAQHVERMAPEDD